VKLTLTSEDVIHSWGVPAFRDKIDVIPGRYVSTWYLPTKTGRFHLFCDQLCGVGHSQMVGTVVVMKPEEYEAWLNGHYRDGDSPGDNGVDGSLAWEGRKLFFKLQCISCHTRNTAGPQRAPVLEGLYGAEIPVRGQARTVRADEAYIRESILRPRNKVHEGWEAIMPTFQGQVSEEDIIKLIAYIRSLRPGDTPTRNEEFPAPLGAPTQPTEGGKQ
jgi:cytochrome c oxidase subunit 2